MQTASATLLAVTVREFSRRVTVCRPSTIRIVPLVASHRRWGVVLVVVVVALLATSSLAVLGWRAARTSTVDPTRRELPVTGISFRPPTGWTDKRGRLDAALVLELEHRPPFPNLAIEGMWIARWSVLPDATGEVAAFVSSTPPGDPRPSVEVDGHRAAVAVERIGPDIADRLPLAWSMVRTRYRFEANGLLYEIGFWDGAGSRTGSLQRRVLDSVRITPPAAQVVRASGLELRVPGGWHRDRSCGVCWFGPGQPAAWVYVLEPRKGRASDVADAIEDEQRARVGNIDRSGVVVDGRPTVRLRFTYPEGEGSSFGVDDLVIQRTDDEVVIVAMGWRTPAGRAELDAVTASLVTSP
jgi:hypothetical protein